MSTEISAHAFTESGFKVNRDVSIVLNELTIIQAMLRPLLVFFASEILYWKPLVIHRAS